MIRTLPIVNSVIRQFCYQCLLFSTKKKRKKTSTDLTDPKSALEFSCFYNVFTYVRTNVYICILGGKIFTLSHVKMRYMLPNVNGKLWKIKPRQLKQVEYHLRHSKLYVLWMGIMILLILLL